MYKNSITQSVVMFYLQISQRFLWKNCYCMRLLRLHCLEIRKTIGVSKMRSVMSLCPEGILIFIKVYKFLLNFYYFYQGINTTGYCSYTYCLHLYILLMIEGNIRIYTCQLSILMMMMLYIFYYYCERSVMTTSNG